jgi:prophage regulatory protein
MATTILRLPDVVSRTGLSRTVIYRRITDRTFPKPVALGQRAIGWRESDIIDWIDSLTTKSARAA